MERRLLQSLPFQAQRGPGQSRTTALAHKDPMARQVPSSVVRP